MKRLMILGAVVAALAVGIVAVAGAAAQEDGERPADHFMELLADNLGVTVEELDTAMTQARIDGVNEKVADGSITADEGTAIIERIESGEGPGFGGPRHGGHHGNHHRIFGLILANSAEVLDMEIDALKAELHEGNSLADVVTAQGGDVETFKADLLTAIEADLSAKVVDESITQETADRILAKITESIDRIVEKAPGDGDGPRPGGPRGPQGDSDGADASEAIFIN